MSAIVNCSIGAVLLKYLPYCASSGFMTVVEEAVTARR